MEEVIGSIPLGSTKTSLDCTDIAMDLSHRAAYCGAQRRSADGGSAPSRRDVAGWDAVRF
jgi:hypothetical protein